jgi:hypothetical protein
MGYQDALDQARAARETATRLGLREKAEEAVKAVDWKIWPRPSGCDMAYYHEPESRCAFYLSMLNKSGWAAPERIVWAKGASPAQINDDFARQLGAMNG